VEGQGGGYHHLLEHLEVGQTLLEGAVEPLRYLREVGRRRRRVRRERRLGGRRRRRRRRRRGGGGVAALGGGRRGGRRRRWRCARELAGDLAREGVEVRELADAGRALEGARAVVEAAGAHHAHVAHRVADLGDQQPELVEERGERREQR